MRKEIIKCDKCGKILDYESSNEDNCEFYTIGKEFISGWAAIDKSFGANSTFQVCLKCFKEFGLSKQL